MYNSYIGKRLIECYNRREGTAHTARSFFDEIYFPLFFDDERYLQNVNNSPVDQAYKQRGKKPLTPERRQECLTEIHRKANEESPDASFFIGGAAATLEATTSGQVTDLAMPTEPDHIYASWIGAALGLGIAGGISLLIDADDVLLATYDGWHEYRETLNQTDNLKPMQINTWNGQWLAYRFGRNYSPGVSIDLSVKENKTSGMYELTTQSWVQILFALAAHYRETQTEELVAYVYNLGQTNSTFGFVRLNLPEVRRPVHLYQILFPTPEGQQPKDFEALYETQFSFIKACEMGDVGLRSIQPEKLQEFMPSRYDSGKIPAKPKSNDDGITFQIYQTWIIAMLNNKDLLDEAEQVAKALHAFREKATRGKKTHDTLVKNVLSAGSRKKFIDELTSIVEEEGEEKELLNNLVANIVTMPLRNVPLFLSLLRFKYAYLSA